MSVNRSRAASSFGRPPYQLCAVEHLAMQIRGVDAVEVHQADAADACRREVDRGRTAEASGADDENRRGFQLALSVVADLGEDEVPRVAGAFFGCERHGSNRETIS